MWKLLGTIVLSLSLMGLTTVHEKPACLDSPQNLLTFVKALEENDKDTLSIIVAMGVCAYLKGGNNAEVLERGDGWIFVRLSSIDTDDTIDVYTVPDGVK